MTSQGLSTSLDRFCYGHEDREEQWSLWYGATVGRLQGLLMGGEMLDQSKLKTESLLPQDEEQPGIGRSHRPMITGICGSPAGSMELAS